MDRIDVVVMGGGIIGLWTAYEILKRHHDLTLVVCEKESYLGEHSSGRNSEVLHSGVYYDSNSLKHLCCLEGNLLWREFNEKHSIAFLNCGKYIVGRKDEEDRFLALFERGQQNQIPGIRFANAAEIENLKRDVRCDHAFFCPSSGVLNVADSIKKLAGLIEDLGGIILRKTELKELVKTASGFEFSLGQDRVSSDILINAGGHFAVPLREQLGLKNFKNRFVKGSYLALKDKLNLQCLVYPMPPKHGLGLGVHVTLDTSGAQKFGPNTEEVDQIDYGVHESIVETMFPSISELFPGVRKQSLAPAYSGIRSKIVNSSGQLEKDFIIGVPSDHGIAGYFEFLGIESPGVTAAPSLARILVSKIFS